MDTDDFVPKGIDDPLAILARQDLDPFSLDELRARIVVLEAEIGRARLKIQTTVNHRASADALFRR
jgi:uncharacterized small protein (DUF1192 family)